MVSTINTPFLQMRKLRLWMINLARSRSSCMREAEYFDTKDGAMDFLNFLPSLKIQWQSNFFNFWTFCMFPLLSICCPSVTGDTLSCKFHPFFKTQLFHEPPLTSPGLVEILISISSSHCLSVLYPHTCQLLSSPFHSSAYEPVAGREAGFYLSLSLCPSLGWC